MTLVRDHARDTAASSFFEADVTVEGGQAATKQLQAAGPGVESGGEHEGQQVCR